MVIVSAMNKVRLCIAHLANPSLQLLVKPTLYIGVIYKVTCTLLSVKCLVLYQAVLSIHHSA